MGGWRQHWLTRPATEDPEPCERSNAMTGACLTVSQVQSIPWSAAPSSTWLLLVTSAFVTPIVTRGNAAKPCAIMAAAVVRVPVSFHRKRRAQVGAIVGQADRLLQASEVRSIWRTSAICVRASITWVVTGRAAGCESPLGRTTARAAWPLRFGTPGVLSSTALARPVLRLWINPVKGRNSALLGT